MGVVPEPLVYEKTKSRGSLLPRPLIGFGLVQLTETVPLAPKTINRRQLTHQNGFQPNRLGRRCNSTTLRDYLHPQNEL